MQAVRPWVSGGPTPGSVDCGGVAELTCQIRACFGHQSAGAGEKPRAERVSPIQYGSSTAAPELVTVLDRDSSSDSLRRLRPNWRCVFRPAVVECKMFPSSAELIKVRHHPDTKSGATSSATSHPMPAGRWRDHDHTRAKVQRSD